MENACSGEKSNNLCYACTPDKNASQDQTVSKKKIKTSKLKLTA
jgi:hypothetical protein